jgi:hypothetical protein
MTRQMVYACVVCSVAWAVGCGPPPDNVYNPGPCAVTGVVTLDGKPIATNGEIMFTFQDGAPPGYAKIQNGTFELKTRAGKQRVEVFAFRPGKPTPEDPHPMPENYIPRRYNTSSTLTADVAPDGPNRYEFHLNSGK